MTQAVRHFRRRPMFTLAPWLVVFLLLFASPARATIRYRISLAHNDQHLFKIEMQIPQGKLFHRGRHARVERSLSDS